MIVLSPSTAAYFMPAELLVIVELFMLQSLFQEISIERSSFTNNSVERGGIINIPESDYLKIANYIFSGIYVRSAKAHVINISNTIHTAIINCDFIDNFHSYSGSVVTVREIGYLLQVNRSTFVNNTGLGIYIDAYNFGSDHILITNCKFKNNGTPLLSGGICIVKANTITIQGCTFTNNTGWVGGGARVDGISKLIKSDSCKLITSESQPRVVHVA